MFMMRCAPGVRISRRWRMSRLSVRCVVKRRQVCGTKKWFRNSSRCWLAGRSHSEGTRPGVTLDGATYSRCEVSSSRKTDSNLAPTYSIVIPAYNESARIGGTLERVLAHVREQRWNAEILVVNDGSTDGTAALVREFAERHGNVLLIENP